MKHAGGLAASLASLQERLKQREQEQTEPQQNKNNVVQLFESAF